MLPRDEKIIQIQVAYSKTEMLHSTVSFLISPNTFLWGGNFANHVVYELPATRTSERNLKCVKASVYFIFTRRRGNYVFVYPETGPNFLASFVPITRKTQQASKYSSKQIWISQDLPSLLLWSLWEIRKRGNKPGFTILLRTKAKVISATPNVFITLSIVFYLAPYTPKNQDPTNDTPGLCVLF